MRRTAFFFVAGFWTIVVFGCNTGPVKHKVTGLVELDGQPVTEGRITFRSKDLNLHPEEAAIDAGKYSVAIAAGTYMVTVRVPKKVPLLPHEDRAYPDETEKIVNLTAHYDDNPLAAEVTGPGQIDFTTLKSRKD